MLQHPNATGILIPFLLFDCASGKKAQQELRPPKEILMQNDFMEMV
jgi:hypothetical protein